MSDQSRHSLPIYPVLIALTLFGGIWAIERMEAAPVREPSQRLTNSQPIADAASNAGQLEEVFELNSTSAKEARRMLRDLLGPMAQETSIVADSSGHKLTIRGDLRAIDLARRLISQVDRATSAVPQVRRQTTAPALTLSPTNTGVRAKSEVKPERKETARGYYCINRPASEIADGIRHKFGVDVTIKTSDTRMLVFAADELHPAINRFREKLDTPTNEVLPTRSQFQNELNPSANSLSRPPSGTFSEATLTAKAEPQVLENNAPASLGRRQTVVQTDGTKSATSNVVNAVGSQPTNQRLTNQQPAENPVDSNVVLTVEVRNRPVDTTQKVLNQLLGDRLRQYSKQSSLFTAKDGRTVNLQFQKSQVQIQGPSKLVNQFATLLRKLDNQSRDIKTRFIRIRKADRAALQRAIEKARQGRLQKQTPAIKTNKTSQRSNGQSSIQPAAFQQPANQDPPELRRPASDIRVEALPDLDVIILQGRDPDVDELTRIIQEIERISEETTPEIEVYQLQHAKDEAVDALIEDVLDDLIGPLQGRVSITPLVKPNALLLIGWGEAVEAVKKLIAKVDVPVDAPTQLKVFPLKNSSASQVEQTITEFFDARGGLSPDAVISSDSRTNSIIVNASPRDLQELKLLIEKLDSGTTEAVNKAKILKLDNSLAADIAQTVEAAIEAAGGAEGAGRSATLEMLLQTPDGAKVMKSGLLSDVRVIPDPRTNTLFISGPDDSIKLIEQLINSLDDEPASTAQLKVFEVRYGSAGELVTVLRTLFPQNTGAAGQLATASGEGSLAPVRFSVDARTNSIIATGSIGDLRIVEALLIRLDQDGSQQRRNQVYRLRNAPAIVVAQAVNEFLQNERVVQQAAPGIDNPFQQLETQVVVVPEPVGNSLLISATPQYFEDIMALIEDLDKQPAQVMIQVILAEVDLDNFHEFGVELGLQDSLLFDRGILGDIFTTALTSTNAATGVQTTTETIQSATNTPGFLFNNNPLGNSGSSEALRNSGQVAGQALSHFSVGRLNSELGYGGLVLSASSENISVLLRALNQSRRVDILSRPQIMTLDNQPAFIQVGERVPRITSSTINQLGQVNQVELADVGLILGVTPRISPDGMVVMEVDAEKSDIGAEAEGIPISVSATGEVVRSPRVNIAVAQTTVSAASGQTVIIGGLITNRRESITRRVPWLSEVPLLGDLFRYDGSDDNRSELLIILTPHVVRNRDDAEHLKQLEMSRMSWCSQDVFEWLTPHPAMSHGTTIDESGVQVIYPDDEPGAPQLQQAPYNNTQNPNTQIPDTVPAEEVWPLEPMSYEKRRGSRSGVQRADFSRPAKSDSRSEQSSRRPNRIRWPFSTRSNKS